MTRLHATPGAPAVSGADDMTPMVASERTPGRARLESAWAAAPVRRWSSASRPPLACCTRSTTRSFLMFMLVSRRYERASLIVTSNKPFSAWGEIFGDEVTAAAMIDRLVHHAEILSLKGDSYRLKDRDLARAAPGEN
jgi:hypothetical protein